MSTRNKYVNAFYNADATQQNEKYTLLDLNSTFNKIHDIDDISKYDMYVTSILITSLNLPYRDMQFDLINKATNANMLKFSISYKNAAVTFANPGADPCIDISPDGHTIQVYINYISDNVNVYYGLFSIDSLVEMINISIAKINTASNIAAPLGTMALQFDPTTALFSFQNIPIDLKYEPTNNICFYMNSFLKNIFNGFRFISKSITTIPSTTFGCDYQLVFKDTTKLSEYPTINNILSFRALSIDVSSALSSIATQENIDISSNIVVYTKTLKSLDLVFDNTLTNSILEYTMLSDAQPITIQGLKQLSNMSLHFSLIDIYGNKVPLYLSSQSCFDIKLLFKRYN